MHNECNYMLMCFCENLCCCPGALSNAFLISIITRELLLDFRLHGDHWHATTTQQGDLNVTTMRTCMGCNSCSSQSHLCTILQWKKWLIWLKVSWIMHIWLGRSPLYCLPPNQHRLYKKPPTSSFTTSGFICFWTFFAFIQTTANM